VWGLFLAFLVVFFLFFFIVCVAVCYVEGGFICGEWDLFLFLALGGSFWGILATLFVCCPLVFFPFFFSLDFIL
jgi:hypothetical protein